MAYIWYHDSDLQKFINTNTKINFHHYLKTVDVWEASIKLKIPPYTQLANVAYDLNNVLPLIANTRLFLDTIKNTLTFETLVDLLESVFDSREVTIEYDATGGLVITTKNNNAALMEMYVDANNEGYQDINENLYYGFIAGEWAGLSAFLERWLARFLPAGRVISSFTIMSS